MSITTTQKGELYAMAADIQSEMLSIQERRAELNIELGRIQRLVQNDLIDDFGEEIDDARLNRILTKTKEKFVKLKVKPGNPKKIVRE